jgi:hypothetical protein
MNSIDIQLNHLTGTIPVLDTFCPISLSEMDSVKLLDRMDTKYMFNLEKMEHLLAQISSEYKILTIDGERFSHYETRYFDTPGMEMYLQHHNGKLNRYKVRFRSYVDSGLSFFEIKLKTNKGRTIKDRIKKDIHDFSIDSTSELMLKRFTDYNSSMLSEAIQINYNRITLVRNNMSERLTIDFGLTFIFKNKKKSLPDLVIAEVKQDSAAKSPFNSLMQANYIPPHSLSKYCLGIAFMNTNVKSNNFKHKLININKLCHDNA